MGNSNDPNDPNDSNKKQKTIIRHSEGAQRLWESSLLFLKIKVGDCHEPKGSRNDDYIKKLMANG